MTKKQVIRLTEGDLHKIIKESVNNILSELDWKTYANAGKEASKRGDADYWRDKGEKGFGVYNKAANERVRANRFGKYAQNAFDRDFGYEKGNEYDYNDDYVRVGMGGDFNSTQEFGPHAAGWKRAEGSIMSKRFPYGLSTTETTPEEFFGDNTDAIQAYNTAKDEIRNYKQGNYDYQKGKGWVKK